MVEENIIFKDCFTGTDFENKVVKFLKGMGFNADKTGRDDGGIDIVATINIHANEYKYYIQCKYYNTTLGKHPVQEAHAGAEYHKDSKGKGTPVVITNNRVTREARLYAKRLGVEIIAEAEWNELKLIKHERAVTNPNTHYGLLGIIISRFLYALDNEQADRYLQAALTGPTQEESFADTDELILKIQNEFDEAEEFIKESARTYQRAAQQYQRGMNLHRDAIIQHLKYG